MVDPVAILLNTIQPDLGLRVNEVSNSTGKGKHTTTHLEMFSLEIGGSIVDTPGMREFGLWNVAPADIAALFPEMRPYVGQCRFGLDCSHAHEPGCAILAALGPDHPTPLSELSAHDQVRRDTMTTIQERHAGFAEVNGVRLYYEVTGQGHPLALIHAGIADSCMWDDHVDTLARAFRVIRYDMRGFGRSAPASGSFSPRQDLHALLAFLGVGKAHLVGVSMGGSLALDATLEHPDAFNTLLLDFLSR